MPTPRAATEFNVTPPFNFIHGKYQLSGWRIPYFSTTMSLRNVARSLKLLADFPGVENITVDIEELYQRDLNWQRVERQILPYLKSLEQPQFFNSLTVALLPIKNNELKNDFSGTDWSTPRFENELQFAKKIIVGRN